MSTFLPYADYGKSASVLDPARLNRQILDCLKIAKQLLNETTTPLDPTGRMWIECPKGVVLFGLACCREYRRRPSTKGRHKSEQELTRLLSKCERAGFCENYPRWFNRNKIHAAYRAHLAAKDQRYIEVFGCEPQPGYWAVDDNGEWKIYSA